jgi:hypothetical protein
MPVVSRSCGKIISTTRCRRLASLESGPGNRSQACTGSWRIASTPAPPSRFPPSQHPVSMRKWKEVEKVLHGKGIRRRHSSGHGSKANALTAKNSSARSSARRIRTLPLLAGHFDCNRDFGSTRKLNAGALVDRKLRFIAIYQPKLSLTFPASLTCPAPGPKISAQ